MLNFKVIQYFYTIQYIIIVFNMKWKPANDLLQHSYIYLLQNSYEIVTWLVLQHILFLSGSPWMQLISCFATSELAAVQIENIGMFKPQGGITEYGIWISS